MTNFMGMITAILGVLLYNKVCMFNYDFLDYFALLDSINVKYYINLPVIKAGYNVKTLPGV